MNDVEKKKSPSPVQSGKRDEEYMRLALEQAATAAEADEIPVGAVVVCGDRVIAAAHNLTESDGCSARHAEMLVLSAAERVLGVRRLDGCTLYVTMEPCPMCAGACVNAHLGHVVFGARDAVSGACGSVLRMNAYPLLFRPEMRGGVLEEECRAILQAFFKEKRDKKQKGACVDL